MRKLAVKIAPFASAIILLLLQLVLPFSVKPPLVLAPVFFYASKGEGDLDSVAGLVLLAAVFDSIEPTRFGLSALILLAFYFVARYQKFFTIEEPRTSFLAFSVLSALAILLKYMLFLRLVSSELASRVALYDWLILAASYPVIYSALSKLEIWRDE